MTTAQPTADTIDESPVLHLTRTFQASRERVFAAFTETEALVKWWGPEGFTLPLAEIDLRPGGAYRFHMQSAEGDIYKLSGTVREVQEPERLVYTWTWAEGEMAGIETLVTLEFRESGDATELVLTHEMFPSAEQRDRHDGGWSSSFGRLQRLLREG